MRSVHLVSKIFLWFLLLSSSFTITWLSFRIRIFRRLTAFKHFFSKPENVLIFVYLFPGLVNPVYISPWVMKFIGALLFSLNWLSINKLNMFKINNYVRVRAIVWQMALQITSLTFYWVFLALIVLNYFVLNGHKFLIFNRISFQNFYKLIPIDFYYRAWGTWFHRVNSWTSRYKFVVPKILTHSQFFNYIFPAIVLSLIKHLYITLFHYENRTIVFFFIFLFYFLNEFCLVIYNISLRENPFLYYKKCI